jgi:hypothetical protein
MITHLTGNEAYSRYAGRRVRVIWNPQIKVWYVYDLTNDFPLFSTFRLELHTVGVYGELKPKFAPDGSPSFVGTIVAHEIVTEGERIKVHPYAPAKMFFDMGNDEVEGFNHCRRLLLDKKTMIADRRPITKDEHEKTI